MAFLGENVSSLKSKYLTKQELDSILKIAKKRSDRDYAIILLSYRHGLRCAELLALQWDWIDWERKKMCIWRAKDSEGSFHDLAKDEISLLKKLKKHSQSDFIIAGRQANSSDNGLSTSRVRQLCKELSLEANLSRPFHHHMLRHTCGHNMAENANINPLTIQRYLGHKDPKSTEIYIREAGRDFKNLGVWWQC